MGNKQGDTEIQTGFPGVGPYPRKVWIINLLSFIWGNCRNAGYCLASLYSFIVIPFIDRLYSYIFLFVTNP